MRRAGALLPTPPPLRHDCTLASAQTLTNHRESLHVTSLETPGRVGRWARFWLALTVAMSVWPQGARAADLLPGGLDRYRATRERPLFSPTRRAPSAPETAVNTEAPVHEVAKPAAPNLSVSGIILGLQTRIAIVRRGGDPTATHVTVGSSIDGWTVSAIGARDVTLQRDQDTISIGLPAAHPSQPPAL